MASIFEAKSNLKQLLLQNKDKLTNEVYEYLLSLIELEFAVTKDYLSKSGKEQITPIFITKWLFITFIIL